VVAQSWIENIEITDKMNKKLLKYLYWNKKYPLRKIGEFLSLNGTTIFYWMEKYNIPRRIGNQTQKGKFGNLSQAWKGGRLLKNGYVLIYNPKHPNTSATGYVPEHRLIMEKHIGRYLKKNELVHHINGIRTDNRLKNLVIVDSSKHEKHTLERILQKRIIYLEKIVNNYKHRNK